MSKFVTIDECEECPKFDNKYYSYNERCTLLDRIIHQVNGDYPIPPDCPLPDDK